MLTTHYHRIIHYSTAVLLVFMLSSCASLSGFFHETPHKPVKTSSTNTPAHQAEIFVYNLALARLVLPANTTDLLVATSSLHIIQKYSAHKHIKPVSQTIMVIEYKSSGSTAMQKIIAPITMSSENTGFFDLLDIMNKLGATPYTLYNISLAQTMVAPYEPLKLSSANTEQVRQNLDQQQQHLLKNSQKLALLDDAQEQLKLISFFMEQRFRDAAYISIDNVKQLLAVASQKRPDDKETITQLSKQLEDIEGQVHTRMPFTLSGQ